MTMCMREMDVLFKIRWIIQNGSWREQKESQVAGNNSHEYNRREILQICNILRGFGKSTDEKQKVYKVMVQKKTAQDVSLSLIHFGSCREVLGFPLSLFF